MASIGIFIGQCGVTMGQQLLTNPPSLFKCYNGSFHTIFVDTEVKVLRQIPKQFLRPDNLFSDFPGCGGCFAKGWTSAETMLDRVMAGVRKELQQVDCCLGLLLFHSFCGGTGSGYGARITEQIKTLYPEMFVVNVAVLPFKTGENPVQSYNVVLAASKLQEYSDMVVLVENSVVASQLAVGTSSKQSVSMKQINEKIIADLQILFRYCEQVPNRCAIWEVMRIVCSIPSIKFCSVGSYFSRNVMENVNRCARSIKQKTGFGKFRSVSGVVLSSDVKSQLLDPRMESKLQKSFNFVEWNPFPVEFWCCKNKEPGMNFAVNTNSICAILLRECDAALLKFDAGAYLHWFEKYGVVKDDFTEAFQSVDKIVEDYAYFCR